MSGMSKLIYIANVSLDGYIEDSHGNFDWTTPSDEVFAFITDLLRSSGTYLAVGGPNLAAHTFRAGLVDECHLLICPVFVGAGKAALPRDTRADLELLDERRFSNGVVYVRYRVAS
jgi:dihydrofolate reductase